MIKPTVFSRWPRMSNSSALYCVKVSDCIGLSVQTMHSCNCYIRHTTTMCVSAIRLCVGCCYEELGFGLSILVLFCSCLQFLLPPHGSGRNLSATLSLLALAYKVLWLLKERDVHRFYALSPHCDGVSFNAKLRLPCGSGNSTTSCYWQMQNVSYKSNKH